MSDRKNVIKALECRKNADKRCGNPCEDTGLCHYATAVRGLDGEIYRPFVCDRERICADALSMLKEQDNEIDTLKTLLLGYEIGATMKEQEAVKPTWSRGKPFCGACGLRISGGKFCSECGRPIAWEGR